MKKPKQRSKHIERYLKTLEGNSSEHYIKQADWLLYRLNEYKSVETIELDEDLQPFYDTLKASPATLKPYKSIITKFLEYKLKKDYNYYRPVIDELKEDKVWITKI